jgi:hypothetical protein
MFRQPHPWYLAQPVQLAPGEQRVVKCPQCGEAMHSMGLDFKAPPQDDVKQWKKVEILFRHGFTFHSCGCCGPGLRPAELREVEAFLADSLPQSEGERLLAKITRTMSAGDAKRRRMPAGESAGEHPLAEDIEKLRQKGTPTAIAASLLQKKRRKAKTGSGGDAGQR